MGGSAVWQLGGWCLFAALTAQPLNRLVAQVAPNRSAAYLFPTDVNDARAIWINPAGLGTLREASIYAEIGVGNPGASGRLRQIDAGFNSRGLAFAYQRDIFDNKVRGNTYRIGLAGGSRGLAAGAAVAHYRGDGAHSTGWDAGLSYTLYPGLTVGLVAANIGQPMVRGLGQRLTYVPGATWHPAPLAALALSTYARITPDSIASYAFGLSWHTPRTSMGTVHRWPIEIIARLDTDGKLRRGEFALGLSIGSRDRVGIVATTPGDVSRVDEASLYGASSREPAGGRH
ncbi:MAG: hypothetical protein AUI08_11485 [Gemmatimonadetes bacterium 13_2_20CM_2_65_7]|nr:MAG: hypothetical protein AUI08_11485 [Gemmatimonadetes bacterium 13_2_20CM_2_65_7]OLC40960.1 MAG: hypothetical protein AUH75_07000 [Gemmatimonadetes bacterium 13_1_40CM_4_65_7]